MDTSAPPPATGGWAPGEFETLFAAQFPRLARMARRLAADASQAEELASQALWRLYRAGPGDRSNLPGWLNRAVVRAGLDALRARKRRRQHEARAAAARVADGSPPRPLERLQAEREAAAVRTVLARLGRREAALLILRYSGATYGEMAAAVSVRPNSIGTLLARAEKAFERQYARRYGRPSG